MERKNEKKIGSLLDEFLRSNNLLQGYAEYKAGKAWSEVLGKNIANLTREVYVRDRKLFVKLNSSVAKNELMLIKEDIIRRLNEQVGAEVIDDIVFR